MKVLLDYIGFELKRFFSNLRLVLIFFISPILATAVFALVTYRAPENIPIGLVVRHDNIISQKVAEVLKSSDSLVVRQIDDDAEGLKGFMDGDIKGYIVIDIDDSEAGEVIIHQDPRYPEVQGVIQQTVNASVLPVINQELFGSNEIFTPVRINTQEYLPKKTSYFDRYASGAIALVIVLIFLLRAATSLSQDRESGVLERLFSTPASRRKIMLSKIISNVTVGFVSVVAIVFMLKIAFNVAMGGWMIVLTVAFLTAVVSVTLGILISAIAKDLASSIQFAFYTFFMMVLTSEFFFARENIYPYFKWVSTINPLTYAISALRKVNLFNWGLSEVWPELVILSVFAFSYSIISIIIIERESK